VPFTDFGDLVGRMPIVARVWVASASLRMLIRETSSIFTFGKSVSAVCSQLIEEAESGRSIIALNSEGVAVRIVSVTVLDLRDQFDRVLVQLGKLQSGVAKEDCQLPAEKQVDGEAHMQALQRMLSTKFGLSPDSVQVQQTAQQVTIKASDRFGIGTKYLRNICRAQLARTPDVTSILASGLAPPAQDAADVGWGIPVQFRAHTVFTVGDRLYSWLDMAEFEYLSSTAGSDDLKAWLSAVAFRASRA